MVRRIPCAGAVAYLVDAQRRERAEFVGEGRHQRRSRWRDHLSLPTSAVYRLALQDLHCGGSRYRENAMLAVDHTRARGKRGDDDTIHAKLFEADARSHDVHDGVHGPDFVEVDLLDGNSVHPRFGVHQGFEHAKGPGLDSIRKPAAFHDLTNLTQSAVLL